jgi:outer membrane lipoprotein SlyB
VIVALAAVLLAGCAGPEPVLYPNEQLRAVGQAQADQDIGECRQLAEQAGASEGSGTAGRAAGRTVAGGAIGGAVGAAGGAVLGRPGTGAAFGAATGATAGLMRSMFGGGGEPSQTYRNVVDRCLRERGYEPAGWD